MSADAVGAMLGQTLWFDIRTIGSAQIKLPSPAAPGGHL